MKVRKITAKWGSKGKGAEVSVWLPNVTYGSYEMLAGGERAMEVQAAVVAAVRSVVRDAFPVPPTKGHHGDITVEMATFDDETGERIG